MPTPIPPGLIALHSNHTDSLLDAVAAWLQQHPLAPLESEVVLVQSNGFDSPKDAGRLIGVLKQAEQADAMETPEIVLQVPVADVLAALAAVRSAEA